MRSTTSSSNGRLSIAVALMLVFGATVGRLLSAGAPPNTRATQISQSARAEEAEFASSYCKTQVATTVPTGSEAEARKYYGDLLAKIGLAIVDPSSGDTGPTTTLVDILAYLGYAPNAPATFPARDLQDAPPDDLMNAETFGRRLGGRTFNAGDVL